MRKDQREELRRLEEALLAPEEPEPVWTEADADEWLEEQYREPAEGYRVYNADNTDVELEAYSEEVHRGRRGKGCLVLLILLLLAVLVLLAGWLLLKLEVIPWL